MIVKIATSKNNDGSVNWTNLYSAAIRNRLRKDKNLSDLEDISAARKNLGVESYIRDYINNTVIPTVTERVRDYIYSDGKTKENIPINRISDNSFSLSGVPDSSSVTVIINGVHYFEDNYEFTVDRAKSPVTISWNSDTTGFSLDTDLKGYIAVLYKNI